MNPFIAFLSVYNYVNRCLCVGELEKSEALIYINGALMAYYDSGIISEREKKYMQDTLIDHVLNFVTTYKILL